MKEVFEQNPAIPKDQQHFLAITNLLDAEEEDFRNLWKDKTFSLGFPELAVYLIGIKGRAEFSEDQRANLFSLSLKTFLQNNNRRLTGYAFTTDGNVVSRDNKGNLVLQIASMSSPKLLPQDTKTDSFTKALTASILLIGMSLKDKEKQRSLLLESYQNLTDGKKTNLAGTLGRLLGKNNSVRTWIKENRLDNGNGFDWDSELSYDLFFGIYASHIEYIPIPLEMEPDLLENYSLQTRSVILDFTLKHAEKLNKSVFNARLTGFTIKMKQMEMTEDMREKLDLLGQKLNIKISQSPTMY